jgi:hypothetical protein
MRKTRVKTEEEIEKIRHHRMNRQYLRSKRRCNRRTSWYTGETLGTVGWTDGPSLVASDELQRKSKEDSITGWSDDLSGDAVGLSDAQFEFIQRRAKTKPSAPDDPMPWSRWSVGLSDSRVKANRGDLDAGSSAPDDPMHRCYIAS